MCVSNMSRSLLLVFVSYLYSTLVVTAATDTVNSTQDGKCVLPPYPDHGTYTVINNPNAVPGQFYSAVAVNIICNHGFDLENQIGTVFCYDGLWSNDMPSCVRFCKLKKDPSVQYWCRDAATGSMECGDTVPSGTVVQPQCRYPNYFSPGPLPNMRCIEGRWDYIATCRPECGLVTPTAVPLVLDGRLQEKSILPWHVGVYKKNNDVRGTKYKCAGSLVSTKVVISAAQCFWYLGMVLPAADFAVAAGKQHKDWDNNADVKAQKTDVEEIKVPSDYQGQRANFQKDIALVVVVTPFAYQMNIRPVCIDFDVNFYNHQMRSGTLGKVAGWGIVSESGTGNAVEVVDSPVLGIDDCYAQSPTAARVYLTRDKICTKFSNNTKICTGSAGVGLVVPEIDQGKPRFYLRGVASSVLLDENEDPKRIQDGCFNSRIMAFTSTFQHEHFLKSLL